MNHSHEMSRLFSEKIKVKLFPTAGVIGALRVNCFIKHEIYEALFRGKVIKKICHSVIC